MKEAGLLGSFIKPLVSEGILTPLDYEAQKSPTWYRERGRFLSRRGRWEEAAERYLAISLEMKEHHHTYQFLAYLYRETGRIKELKKLCQRAERKYGDKWYRPYFIPPS